MKMLLLVESNGGHKDWHFFSGEDVDARIEAVAETYKKRGDRCTVVEAMGSQLAIKEL